jgi:hypothetical protein
VSLVERNHVVEQLTAAASHPSLRYSVLPGACNRTSQGRNAHCANRGWHFESVFPVVIEHHESGDVGIWEGISELLSCPDTGWMPGDIKVTVGTAKKSTAAIASRWLCRKVRQRCAASLSLGARLIQRETVRSETSKPTIKSSPGTRGAPQLGFSATILKISSRISFEIFFLPGVFRTRESMLQYQRNPARCHCTTVSGLTKMSASFQEDQRRRASSQKSLSAAVSFGRGCLRLKTLNCCRSAKFSVRSLLREQKQRKTRPSQRRNMGNVHTR